MFLDRCLTFPGYSILIYMKETKESDDLLWEIMDYYKSKGDAYKTIRPQIFVDEDGENPLETYTVIKFENGSTITIAPLNAWLGEQKVNVVMYDTKIKKQTVTDTLKPVVEAYVMENGLKMVNPKFLKFLTRREV